MGAPSNAIPLEDYADKAQWGMANTRHLTFECIGCGYKGTAGELLTEPEGNNQTLWCPQCRGATWVWD
jgi:hypothetical protein